MRCIVGVDQKVRPYVLRSAASTLRSSVPARNVTLLVPKRPLSRCVNTARGAVARPMNHPHPEPTTLGRWPVASHTAHSLAVSASGVLGAEKHPKGEWPARMRARAPALANRKRSSSTSAAHPSSTKKATGLSPSSKKATSSPTKPPVSRGASSNQKDADILDTFFPLPVHATPCTPIGLAPSGYLTLRAFPFTWPPPPRRW